MVLLKEIRDPREEPEEGQENQGEVKELRGDPPS